ncbi:hypothetical protein TTHERM_000248389 (macronuclear) [Tetrahymena thermophila SB210]|uniref:Uncharacterized protein n=1 Tax=Tetrahymena thermophila (strain SB210) TaxID=312017 RepID=W7WYV9_TETTS|nr:hypothetical protein TTHERM_000248389 [Tetrahymena thermophila SB210]EWS72095.1 hypothetical protein TTHERM_000248389 [Tetrahymena thermophila SB210]|eukprot:XP_012655406.1 hypothetical protein TTHERM_000248389 [Tetrahymena thermophila SB210]
MVLKIYDRNIIHRQIQLNLNNQFMSKQSHQIQFTSWHQVRTNKLDDQVTDELTKQYKVYKRVNQFAKKKRDQFFYQAGRMNERIIYKAKWKVKKYYCITKFPSILQGLQHEYKNSIK